MVIKQEFTFPSSDGVHTVAAAWWRPEGPPRGVVQLVHGISEHIGRYDSFARFLAEHGFAVVGHDHLGHGRTARNPSEFGWFADRDGWKHVVKDVRALREREGDLLLLIDHFCRNIGASFTLSPELERLLLAHQWRGNIRELRNVVEYFSYLGHTVVGVEELPPTFHYLPAAAPPAELPALADCPREDARFVLEQIGRAHV